MTGMLPTTPTLSIVSVLDTAANYRAFQDASEQRGDVSPQGAHLRRPVNTRKSVARV